MEYSDHIGHLLVSTMKMVNKHQDRYGLQSQCSAFSELVGMVQILQTMRTDLQFEFADNQKNYAAVVIDGKRYQV